MINKNYIEKNIEKILNSNILFLEGYFILNKYDIIEYLLNEYDNDGRKIAFNISASFLCKNKKNEVKKVCNHSNYIFGTFEEIEELTGDFTKDGDVLSKKFHESLETTSKHRHLVLMKGEVYCLVSSYDYSNNTYIKEGEYSVGENKKFIDLSGTREGIIIFFIFKK